MKIAYLITAYNNYLHLRRLLHALNEENVVFFIHIDKKSKMPDNLNEFHNIVFIDRKEIWWGSWSHVDAVIRLMRTAIKYGFDYYILLSGTDYPIRPNSWLYKKLSYDYQYINISHTWFHDEDRIKYYYFDGFDRRAQNKIKTIFFRSIEKTLALFFQKRSYPFYHIYDGSTWWALSHDCVEYIIYQIDNNGDYVNFFKKCCIPEESFFQTIIGNSPFLLKCKTNLTYADWSSDPSPALISQKHIDLFKKQTEFHNGSYGPYTPFFARKFNDNSENSIELIENELRV